MGTEKGIARLIRNKRNDNVEMDDGNKKGREDRARRNKSKGRCGKHKWVTFSRSETEVVRICGEKAEEYALIRT